MSESYLKSKKILSPKLDVVFQALFGEVGSEKITGRFLQSILKQEVSEVDLSQNIVLRREQEDDKLGILDIIAKILYYWSKIYARQLKKGQKYRELEKTIVILIANFEIKGLEDLKYHTEWKIMDKETQKVILTDKFELRIIELPKIKEEEQEELIDWLLFLENPQSERVKTKMEENEELKEAVEKLQGMSEDDYMQRIADLREKAILDYNSGMDTALRKGIKKGKLETAKKMLEKGMDIDTIIEVTGLSKEEIVS